MQRRAFFRGVGVGVASLLAGCASGGGSKETTSPKGNAVEVDLVNYKFDPGTDEALNIDAGTTVRFVWKTGGHSIHVDSQPDGANWKGHENVEDAGFSVEHTFDVKGKYHFWCVPHKSLGMIGDIVVS